MCVCIGISLGCFSIEALICLLTLRLSLFTVHTGHLTVAEVGAKQAKKGGKCCFSALFDVRQVSMTQAYNVNKPN